MSDEMMDRSEWLKEPVEAGSVRLSLELGDGATLTPAATEALEALMEAIHEAEVSGFMINRGFNVGLFGGLRLQASCDKMVCNKHDCTGTFSCDTYKSNLI